MRTIAPTTGNWLERGRRLRSAYRRRCAARGTVDAVLTEVLQAVAAVMVVVLLVLRFRTKRRDRAVVDPQKHRIGQPRPERDPNERRL